MILPAHAKRPERNALVQTLLAKGWAEEVEAALVRVLRQDERDEIERIGSSKLGPPVSRQTSRRRRGNVGDTYSKWLYISWPALNTFSACS